MPLACAALGARLAPRCLGASDPVSGRRACECGIGAGLCRWPGRLCLLLSTHLPLRPTLQVLSATALRNTLDAAAPRARRRPGVPVACPGRARLAPTGSSIAVLLLGPVTRWQRLQCSDSHSRSSDTPTHAPWPRGCPQRFALPPPSTAPPLLMSPSHPKRCPPCSPPWACALGARAAGLGVRERAGLAGSCHIYRYCAAYCCAGMLPAAPLGPRRNGCGPVYCNKRSGIGGHMDAPSVGPVLLGGRLQALDRLATTAPLAHKLVAQACERLCLAQWRGMWRIGSAGR